MVPVDCPLLDRYLMGDCDPNERTAFESHLSVCADCRQAIELTHSIESTLAEAAHRNSPPVTLVESISNERRIIRQQNQRLHWKHAAIAIGSLAACITLLAGGSVWVLKATLRQEAGAFQKTSLEETRFPPASVGEPVLLRPSIRTTDEFLVAADPRNDESVEFYWVLPKLTSFRN